MEIDINVVIKIDCVMRRYENLQYGDDELIRKSLDALADKATSVEEVLIRSVFNARPFFYGILQSTKIWKRQ